MSIPTAILEETWPNAMVEGTIDIPWVSIPSATLDEIRPSAVVDRLKMAVHPSKAIIHETLPCAMVEGASPPSVQLL